MQIRLGPISIRHWRSFKSNIQDPSDCEFQDGSFCGPLFAKHYDKSYAIFFLNELTSSLKYVIMQLDYDLILSKLCCCKAAEGRFFMINARLKLHRGAPAIFINGEYTEPTMLFGRLNPEFYDESRKAAYQSEIVRAASSGVHIHTMFLYMDVDMSCSDEESNKENRENLYEILRLDPEGYLIPRCLVPYDHTVTGTPDSENERFTDGVGRPGEDYIRADFISPIWRQQALTYLMRFIRSILADPILCDRVIGYHFSGGETGEWFQRRYHDGVLNVSDANDRQFRLWLKRKYGNEQALSIAWEREVTFETASVPSELPGVSRAFSQVGLLEGAGSRRFIDYLDYFSDEITDLIEEAAALVKRETDGNSLFVSFYGYHFEIPGAYSGHNSLAKLLRCPDVDILTSPVSYVNRNEGGMGAFMNEASSVMAAGKLWLDESDYRMPVVRVPKPGDPIPGIASMDAAREVILREYGKLALNGSGTWWMDLFNIGWFDDDLLWSYIAEGRRYYDQMREAAKPAVAEVCYLVDEKAMSLVGNTWNFATRLLGGSRNNAYFTGLSYDMHLIEDFLDGKLDGAKLYIFLNPFRLEDRGIEKITQKLRENRATALWMFGFPLSADRATLKELTGFDFLITPETAKELQIEGTSIPRVEVSPLTVPQNGEVLGSYPDGRPAFAHISANGFESYFCGGSTAVTEIVRLVAEAAGARLYKAPGDCFNRIGDLAMLHTSTAGEKTLHFGMRATELRSGIVYEDGRCTINAKAGETFLFILSNK